MKITERDLMVGDWVQYGDIHPVKTRVLAISSVDKGKHWHIEVEPENANSMRIVAMHAVEPIPLNAEILEKNGVKCEEIIQPHWISEDGRILLRNDESLINSNNKWSVHVDNEDMQTIGYFEITYVHELQHALRLAGIEKNIIV